MLDLEVLQRLKNVHARFLPPESRDNIKFYCKLPFLAERTLTPLTIMIAAGLAASNSFQDDTVDIITKFLLEIGP